MRNKTKAFTLGEIAIVIVIIGSLATLAVPYYIISTQKSKSMEGVQILTDFLKAENRYAQENGGKYTANLSQLDIQIYATSYFSLVTPWDNQPQSAFIHINGVLYPVRGTIFRQENASILYMLQITDDGRIACSDGTAHICQQMGYDIGN